MGKSLVLGVAVALDQRQEGRGGTVLFTSTCLTGQTKKELLDFFPGFVILVVDEVDEPLEEEFLFSGDRLKRLSGQGSGKRGKG